MTPRPSRDAGFTLIEVIVALAILGVAVVASIQGFAGGLRLLKLSGDHQQAMLLADQKMREAVQPEEGRKDGTAGAFTWERTTSVVPAPELEGATGPKWRVFRIEVKVKWEKRAVELATLRTVPIVTTPETTTTGMPASTTGTSTTTPGTSATTPGRTTTTPGRTGTSTGTMRP
jgi:prepilin-type N-terminal cleavage/methylation domain-containing protein